MRNPRTVTTTAAAVRTLRRALTEEAGADAAARLLQTAGMAAGDALYDRLADGGRSEEALRGLSVPALMRRLADTLAGEGWGVLRHEPLHTGVGVLESPEWPEADDPADEARPSCFFTTGLLANLLGRIAGSPVAVLEVACRSQGDDLCRFAFGGEPAVAALHRSLSDGLGLEASLRRLE